MIDEPYMIEDFVGVFDGVFTEQFCDSAVDFFEEISRNNRAFSRQDLNDGVKAQKNDSTYFMQEPESDEGYLLARGNIIGDLNEGLAICHSLYSDKYDALQFPTTEKHMPVAWRMQKTRPGEGYHVWHYETGNRILAHRVLAVIVYLNDVEEGGETEFLYQHKRVAAKKGRVLIWPGAFTHLHRGNPPISNDKYIITTWFEMCGS